MQTSMPSVQLSLVASDQQQQQSIRTQYATYVQGTTAPPHLSISATTNNSLSVPRYIDESNQRPSKSPRHASHQSVHSTSSLTNTDSPNEYRFGPPYGAINSNPNDMSPQTSQPPAYGGHAPQDNAATTTSATTTTAPPPRDYFPSSNAWTTTAGEPSAPTYTNGDHRPYGFPDQYKTTVKSESHPQPPAYHSQRGSFDAMNHYSWNTT